MMLGLKTGISETNSRVWSRKNSHGPQWVDMNDFMEVVKYTFPPGVSYLRMFSLRAQTNFLLHRQGSLTTPAHRLGHTFKYKEYSPKVFLYLRRMFGINEFNFINSVCGNANFIKFASNAKSGQFLFYSPDGKYMIKTITTTESKFLRRILPHYFRHCAQNPNTLLSKFFGMYRVKVYHLRRRVKFIVMNSVFDTDRYIHGSFDLKGSSKGRDAPVDWCKKDNDLRKLISTHGGIVIGDKQRRRVRDQLEKDCAFLSAMKIMDYSLLVGVHNKPLATNIEVNPMELSPGGTVSQPSVEVESSFRKGLNQIPTNVSKYRSISLLDVSPPLDDSVPTTPVFIPQQKSGSTENRPAPLFPLPPLQDNANLPPMHPRSRSVKPQNRKAKSEPGGGMLLGVDMLDTPEAPSIASEGEDVVSARQLKYHSHNHSSIHIPVDICLDSEDNESLWGDSTAGGTADASHEGGAVLVDMAVDPRDDDDNSYLNDDHIMPASQRDKLQDPQKLENFKHNSELLTEKVRVLSPLPFEFLKLLAFTYCVLDVLAVSSFIHFKRKKATSTLRQISSLRQFDWK